MTFGGYPGLNQHLAMKAMFNFWGLDFLDMPEMTESQLKWGELKSPEYACFPFKAYLGYWRALAESGVNNLFVHGMRHMRGCRYPDLLAGIQKILRQEGYKDFTFHIWGGYGLGSTLTSLKEIAPRVSWLNIARGIGVYIATLQVADQLNDWANEMRPREKVRGSVDAWLNQWEKKISQVRSRKQVWALLEPARESKEALEIDKQKPLLKIVFVGDMFKVHEPFFHFDTIRKLNQLGVEVKQPQAFSLMMIGTTKSPARYPYRKQFQLYQQKAKKYLRSIPASYFDVGIGETITQLEQGAQGIVHFQSFGCMPDIMFKSILQRIAKDYNVPILHYLRDTQASDLAYQTRLEAFVDLIRRRKKAEGSS